MGTGDPPEGWHTGTPCPSSPLSLLNTPLSAGRVLLPSPGHTLPGRVALGTASQRCRRAVTDARMVTQLWSHNGDRTRHQPRAAPAPHPNAQSPGPPAGTAQLYPPVMVAASRRLPTADTWDMGPAWGRAAADESGLGWMSWAGRCWSGGVTCGSAVSSLAGVMLGGWLPWGEAPSSLAPWSSTGRQRSPFSGSFLERRSC